MGFPVPPIANSTSKGQVTASAVTVTFPTEATNGDLCLLFGATTSAGGTAATASAGWTSRRQDDATADGMGRVYLFSHTYADGDTAPTITVTGGGSHSWMMIVVRSSDVNAASLISSMGIAQAAQATNALLVPVASFASATNYDLKVLFMATVTVNPTITIPTEAKSAANFWGNGFTLLDSNTGGFIGIKTFMATSPTAEDSASSNWTSNSSMKSMSYAVNLTDGSGRNGGLVDLEFEPAALVPIQAVALEGVDAISAAAGIFGGGADLL